jgi:TonB family protein
MNAIFLYLLKAALINALMLGFYHFAIRPGRNFKLMRAVLVLSIILPLLLPLIPQPILHRENSAIPLYVFALPETSTAIVISPEENQRFIPLLQNTLYLGITSILLLGLFISVISVIRKYLKTYKMSTPYGKVLIDNKANSPYSFFRWVFFSEEGLLHPAANWLLKHEFSHVRHGHSFDRLLSGLFRSFFWFSPFAHFNNRLLSEVHEYQADADAIEEYGNRTAYSNLIVTFAGLHGQQALTNPFSAHLKKRMIMLNYLKPGKLSIVRLLSGITIIMAVALFSSMIRPKKSGEKISFTQKEQITEKDTSTVKMTIVYDSPDEKLDAQALGKLATIPPTFPGGDDARIAFFRNNIIYPASAREKNIQGTVLYRVIIDKFGKVTDPSIKKGIGGGCDEEVLRVVNMMPDWNPGNVNGEPVNVEMIIPVSFTLSDNEAGKLEDKKRYFLPGSG